VKSGKIEYRMGTGATSMLIIFVLLSLATLSILSLTTARLDLRLSERNATMTAAYYGAVNAAQDALMALDGQLADRQANGGDLQAIADSLPNGQVQDDTHLAMRLDAGFGRYLDVVVEILPPGEGARYRVVKHAMGSPDDWTPDNGDVHLYTGENAPSATDVPAVEDIPNLG